MHLSPRKAGLNLLGSFILAFGVYQIHSISGVTEGGCLGLTLLLWYRFRISPALCDPLINGLCYFIGWKTLDKNFLPASAIAAGGFAIFYAVFERFPRLYPGFASHPFYAAVAGAVFVGVGVGLCVRGGGAPGGDDAIAMALSKRYGFKIRHIYLISDLTVLALSLTYIPFTRIAWSCLTVVLSGLIIDAMQKIRGDASARPTA